MYVRILRWSRLLLGREFKFAETHVLRIWDCLFSADVVDGEEEKGGKEKEIVKLENREITPSHIPYVKHGYSRDTSTSSSSSDSIFDSTSTSNHSYPEYLNDGSQVQAMGDHTCWAEQGGNPVTLG